MPPKNVSVRGPSRGGKQPRSGRQSNVTKPLKNVSVHGPSRGGKQPSSGRAAALLEKGKGNKRQREQEAEPATEAWGWVTSKEYTSIYNHSFKMLEIYATVDDANRRIKPLQASECDRDEEDWKLKTGSHGELELAHEDLEGEGIVFKVTRMPSRAAGYVTPVESRKKRRQDSSAKDPPTYTVLVQKFASGTTAEDIEMLMISDLVEDSFIECRLISKDFPVAAELVFSKIQPARRIVKKFDMKKVNGRLLYAWLVNHHEDSEDEEGEREDGY